jgi:hypothetical protein
VHLYLHRFYDPMGGAWIWCSVCRSYEHDRRQVPSWWINGDLLGLEALTSPPEALESISNRVDEYWNGVVPTVRKEI